MLLTQDFPFARGIELIVAEVSEIRMTLHLLISIFYLCKGCFILWEWTTTTTTRTERSKFHTGWMTQNLYFETMNLFLLIFLKIFSLTYQSNVIQRSIRAKVTCSFIIRQDFHRRRNPGYFKGRYFSINWVKLRLS